MKRIYILAVFFILLVSGPAKNDRGSAFSRISERQSLPIEFYHESRDARELDLLLEEFDYQEYLSTGGGEFEKMILLKDWVFYNLEYDFSLEKQNLFDSLKILRMARRGESFHCVNIATVFMQAAVSLGWTARYFFLRKPTGEEHTANDIWSNQYRKWVFIDPTWNIHVLKNGVPLSILEIRDEWIKNNGRNLIFVYGAGMTEKRYSYADFPIQRSDSRIWITTPVDDKWLGYTFEIAMLGRNNLFSIENTDSSEFWDHIYIIKDWLNGRDWGWSFKDKKIVLYPWNLFHDINRVDMQALRKVIFDSATKTWKGTADVLLNASGINTFCPNFNNFEAKLNNGAWETKPGRFQMELAKGMNVIYSRIQNKFGATGPETAVKIYNP